MNADPVLLEPIMETRDERARRPAEPRALDQTRRHDTCARLLSQPQEELDRQRDRTPARKAQTCSTC
jgi:hypothetical protein